MEVVEEPPLLTDMPSSEEVTNLKDKDVSNEVDDVVVSSNGDAESKPLPEETTSIVEDSVQEEKNADPITGEENKSIDNVENEPDVLKAVENETDAPKAVENDETSVVGGKELLVVESIEIIETQEVENTENNVETLGEETVVEVDGIVENTIENVTFETEILVESNVTDIEEHLSQDKYDESNNAILNDLDQNIDLSEVLRSSDVSENVENNNCEQEVFNKEELLDILEGNDNEQSQSRKHIADNFQADSKKFEEQLALQQLSRLQSKKSKNKKVVEKKTTKKRLSRNGEGSKKEVPKKDDSSKEDTTKGAKENTSNDEIPNQEVSKEESIVNELVKDWEDDEHVENDTSKKLRKSIEKIPKDQNESVTNNDVSMEDGLNSSTNKSGDESQPQRRFGRVIKKKVIFDPDNPDTFTKIKTQIKKETPSDIEQTTPLKKVKSDPTSIRSKSKSPINKLQWKKPPPKNSKQHKRLTEIDKLLMDEGAVNMICQLTPEAPKGKKNMKSKAEFIKKIQSNTPDTKEMKFRERKKEHKTEDGEPKKIGGGKHRFSLSSSVKSPSVCEDFEATSADDSIIYRRHSSSSYSSSCMSPRRLSDVEGNPNQNANASAPLQNTVPSAALQNATPERQKAKPFNEFIEVFVQDNTSTPPKEIMNKRDCLSIKEKLNSKLSQVLNKRKRDSIKTEKPSKVKKVSSNNENVSFGDNKFVKLNFKDKVAEVGIGSTGSLYNAEVLRELNNVISYINSIDNVNVMLFILESDNSGIDLLSIFKDEKMAENARELAEAATGVQSSLAHHNKLTCFGINGRCEGLNLAFTALCDLSIASEMASFSLLEHNGILLQPGVAVLQERIPSQNLINDMVLFGKNLSASEALQSGLVSRVIWPERFAEQVRGIAKDIAAQQPENLRLKKQFLGLKKKSELIASIEKEQEHLIKYWTSAEGLEMLRSNLNSA